VEAPIEFDLAPVEQRERFQFWHDVGSRIHRPVPARYQDPHSLMVRATLLTMGEVVMGRMTSTPQHFERTEPMIRRDHVDSFLLILMERGTMRWIGAQEQYQANQGDLLLLNNSDVFRSEWSEHRQIYAVMPRDYLRAPGWPQPRTALLKAADPRAQLLHQHLIGLWRQQLCPPGPPSSLPPPSLDLGLGLASLTRIYFSERCAALKPTAENDLHSLSAAIQQWLNNNLHRSDLDANNIAATFHISRSTLYELFRPWGGVRTYLQTRRLERARDILESAGQPIGISQLAISLGFRSVSSFSRSFHERWGMAPKQARQQGRQQPDPAPHAPAADGADLQALTEQTQRYYAAIRRLSHPTPSTPPPG